jgi:predicted nucleotidyltransferase
MKKPGRGRSGQKADPLSLVVERLIQSLGPERIYLFGSRARGDSSADSDYDILVVVSQSQLPRYARAQIAYQGLIGVGVPLDVIVLTREEFEEDLPVSSSLPSTVAREGRLLYAS